MPDARQANHHVGDVPMHVGGTPLDPHDGQWLDVVDPASGATIGRIPRGGEAEIEAAVAAARQAADDPAWRRLRPSARAALLRRAADLVRERLDELTAIESRDVGKPLSQARGDVMSGAKFLDYCAGAVDKMHGYTIPVEPGALDYTQRVPWGVSAHIVPWNFPFHLATRGVVPALAMGNAVVLKPAEDASLSCLALADLLTEAGFPAGTINVVTGLGSEAGAALASHPQIDHLTFTGSVATGAAVTRLTSDNVIPLHLELGGKSPQIVLDDADLDRAIPVIVKSFVVNAGQTCSAGTRLLVHERVHRAVTERVVEAVRRLRVGPWHEDPDMGPLISLRQRARVEGFLERARHEGLRPLVGGGVPDRSGFYVDATVFDDVPATSTLFQEEVFGPVLTVTPFTDDDMAVKLANATRYGLLAAVWTRDLSRAFRFVDDLQAGQVYVNSYGLAESTPLPFGGMKRSGHGRDKGLEGLLTYSQLKNVGITYA